MSGRGEAHPGAEGSKEHMFVHKKTVNAKFHVLVDLDKLRRDFDNALLLALAPLRTVFPFILMTDQPQITSAALTSSMVTSDPGTPPEATIALKSAVEG